MVMAIAGGCDDGGSGPDGLASTSGFTSVGSGTTDGGADTERAVDDDADGGTTTSDNAADDGTEATGMPAFDLPNGMPTCGCSEDGSAVLDCSGGVATQCDADELCDPARDVSVVGCDYASEVRGSDGCEFFATYMDNARSALDPTFNGCFAAAVANTWRESVQVDANYMGVDIEIATFGRLISAAGDGQFELYDDTVGLPPGRVLLLFLSGINGGPPDAAGCPIPSAVPSGVVLAHQTGVGNAFELQADAPVSVYQFNPYGGGGASITGASLLLPSAAWGTEYLAINAHGASAPPDTIETMPSMNIVAQANDTNVTVTPSAAIAGGGVVPAGAAGVPLQLTLQRGQHLQLSQMVELTGSTVTADKPVGFMAGHSCMFVPTPVSYCDHGEQMIPPAASLGSKYVGVMHRPRGNEPGIFRVIGAIDGTQLTWSSPVGGPATLDAGQVVEFSTATAFTVESQDTEHPFIFLSYMSGNQWAPAGNAVADGRVGDADVVIGIPTDQYQRRTTFMTDPTFPEANLVVVRKPTDGVLHDVSLDCFGSLDGWTPVGEFEWTRFDLTTGGVSAPGCAAGHQTLRSDGEFTVTVWGWGDLASGTGNVSYGFPAGMRIDEINKVTLPTPG